MTENKIWPSFNHVIEAISRCDVILRCKDKLFVGLYYNYAFHEVPVVVCRGAWNFNYFLMKVAEMMGIPCVDNQLLTRELYEELKEGDSISFKFCWAIAEIYSNWRLNPLKKKMEEPDFYEQLNNDALAYIYILEKKIIKKVERRFFKNIDDCNHLYEGDVFKYFEEKLGKLAEEDKVNFRSVHNAEKKIDEYYLDIFFEKYNMDFWQTIFVSAGDKKIYIGSKNFFRCFDFSKADVAFGFVKIIVEAWKGELWNKVQKFIEEFEINPRLYDIAQNTIKTMVEMNYSRNGYEYGFDFIKTFATIYLKKSKSPGMYKVLITYNEFLRHPEVFKNLIKAPRKFNKWNFCCREVKYNQNKFDQKFQSKTKPSL